MLLHEFSGADGTSPVASLTLIGQTLYGTAYQGGTNDLGTIFKLQTNGTSFQGLHVFGGTADGRRPQASFFVDGSTLYSTTSQGGLYGRGTVYKIGSDGGSYQVLRNLTDFTQYPTAAPILVDGNLYGTTVYGGSSGAGLIYRLSTDGASLQDVHIFDGFAADAAWSHSSLTQVGSKLFGISQSGGLYNSGAIFSLNPDGSDYQVLYEFNGLAHDGSWPASSLIVSDSVLYGTTRLGGASNRGTVFKINTDGSGYQLLHEFAGGAGDGAEPRASLTLVGDTLYGTTGLGGASDLGTVFKINTDGSGFDSLHEFVGGDNDGSQPWASLTFDGSNLYGTTRGGGHSDQGTVFALLIPEPSTYSLALFGLLAVAVWGGRRARRRAAPLAG